MLTKLEDGHCNNICLIPWWLIDTDPGPIGFFAFFSVSKSFPYTVFLEFSYFVSNAIYPIHSELVTLSIPYCQF